MNIYENTENKMPSYLANLKYDQGILSNNFYELDSNFQQLGNLFKSRIRLIKFLSGFFCWYHVVYFKAEMQFEQNGSFYSQYVRLTKDTGLSKKDLSTAKAAVTSATKEKDTQAKIFAIKKRSRKMFSQCQIKILEDIFDQNHYPDSTTRVDLSVSLDLSVHRIQVWFQNRRAKYRKMDVYRAIKKWWFKTRVSYFVHSFDSVHTNKKAIQFRKFSFYSFTTTKKSKNL